MKSQTSIAFELDPLAPLSLSSFFLLSKNFSLFLAELSVSESSHASLSTYSYELKCIRCTGILLSTLGWMQEMRLPDSEVCLSAFK
jgi:hypothetical protein